MKRAQLWLHVLAGMLAFAVPLTTTAQQPAKIPRIAYVYLYELGPSAPYLDDFRQGMRELGWIEGKNIIIEYRNAGANPEKLAAIMRELVDSSESIIEPLR